MLSGEGRLRNITREVLPALRETETKRDTTVTCARKRAPTTSAFRGRRGAPSNESDESLTSVARTSRGI
jgi:hypothetical protein